MYVCMYILTPIILALTLTWFRECLTHNLESIHIVKQLREYFRNGNNMSKEMDKDTENAMPCKWLYNGINQV